MIHQLFAVRDSKAEAYMQPFFTQNTATAVRALAEAVSDTQHTFHKFASDYDLFHIGSFDDATGKLDTQVPVHVTSLLALVKAPEEPAPLLRAMSR